MAQQGLIDRIGADPKICGGQPCIRGTRVFVATILDGLAEGLTPEELLDHYPQLCIDDVHAALAYGAELARENVWKMAGVS
jgi:uncharacterized protein (DUF433 family)